MGTGAQPSLGWRGAEKAFVQWRRMTLIAAPWIPSARSGTSIDRPTRISKIGNAALRSALYRPVLAAMRLNPRDHRPGRD